MRHASQKGISGEMNSHTTKSTIHENNDVKDENESSQIRHDSHKEASREIISHTPKSTIHKNNDAKDENESLGDEGTIILSHNISRKLFRYITCDNILFKTCFMNYNEI